MTIVPSGLIDPPEVPPILEQHAPPWARSAPPRRAPLRRAALVVLVLVTVLVGASAVRDRSGPAGSSDAGPAPVGAELGGTQPTLGG